MEPNNALQWLPNGIFVCTTERCGRYDSELWAVWGGSGWVGRAFFVIVLMTDEGAVWGGGREYDGEVWSWGGNQYWGESEVWGRGWESGLVAVTSRSSIAINTWTQIFSQTRFFKRRKFHQNNWHFLLDRIHFLICSNISQKIAIRNHFLLKSGFPVYIFMILFRKFSIYHSCQAKQKSIWPPLSSSLYWSIAINILVLLTRILRGLAPSCWYQRARSQQPLISVTIVTITHPKLSHIDFPHKCLVVRLLGFRIFPKSLGIFRPRMITTE